MNLARLASLAVTAVSISIACCAQAQDYPARSVRIVLPFAPGGGNDTMARLVAGKLNAALGQRMLVENRPGGGSVIASETVLQAPADGYTLYLVSSTVAAAPSLQKNLSFDTIRDFAPITRLGVVPGALTVHAQLPVKDVRQLLALARARPGEITFGSGGIGAGSHIGGEIFKHLAKVNLLHIPYKSTAQVTQSLLAGEVMVSFANPLTALPYVKNGRLRILGLTTAARWPLLPEYPTIAESGVPGYEFLIWNGMVVKAGTAPAIIDRLHRELATAMTSPDVVSFLQKHGSRAMTQTPAEFAAFMKHEINLISEVVRAAGIRIN